MLDFAADGKPVAVPERGSSSEEMMDLPDGAPRRHGGPVWLEKWYADIFDGTSVRVLYRASLRLGPLTLGYVGDIGMSGRSSCRFVMGGAPLPRSAAGSVAWPADSAQPAYSWSGSCSRRHRLWQRGRRLVDWDPLVLNGRVSGEGVGPASRGYVERLAINCGPWHLGLKRLKWGRFCGERHSLVWIEWEGSHPLQLALLDGQAHRLEWVTATQACGKDVVLQLGTPRLLVQESMAEGALRGLPLPTERLTRRFLRAVETKWVAFGELQMPGGVPDPGHAVFEEVTWH